MRDARKSTHIQREARKLCNGKKNKKEKRKRITYKYTRYDKIKNIILVR